jgi:hypothetical protein
MLHPERRRSSRARMRTGGATTRTSASTPGLRVPARKIMWIARRGTSSRANMSDEEQEYFSDALGDRRCHVEGAVAPVVAARSRRGGHVPARHSAIGNGGAVRRLSGR